MLKKSWSLLVAVLLSSALFAQEPASAVNPLLGKDVKLAKREIVGSNIRIADMKKSTRFWEIYSSYEKSSNIESNAYQAFLKKYSGLSAVMTSATADAISKELFQIQSARASILKKTYDQLRKEISPSVAARFLLIENRISLLEDFQCISVNPLALPEGERVIEVTVE